MRKLIKFGADWCAPCRSMDSVLEEVSKKYSSDLSIQKVDVDEDEEMTSKYNIRSVPTFVLVDSNENELSRIVGPQTVEQLIKFIESC